MSVRFYAISAGWFVLGLLVGIAGTTFISQGYWGRQTEEGLRFMKEAEVGEFGQRASMAYRQEVPAVGIYALTQYLEVLARDESWLTNGAVFMTPEVIAYDRILAYARLAKTYERSGRLAEATEAMGRAVDCARRNPKFHTFTNVTMLTELVKRMDSRPVR